MPVKKRSVTALIVLCVTLLIVCGKDASAATDKKGTMPPPVLPVQPHLAIAINTTIKSAPLIIAQQAGFFTANGLDVELIVKQSGVKAINALHEGHVAMATVPEHIAAFDSLKRDDFQIVAVINRNQSHELIGRKDHGINSVSDLRGKKVAITKKSASSYWLHRLLVYNSLSMADIELIDASPPELVQLITEGSVDAVNTWHPHAYKSREALGENAFYLPTQLGQDMFWLLIGSRQWLAANPAVTVRLLKALEQTARFIKTKPDEAKTYLAAFLKLEKNYLDFEWPLHRFVVELPQNLILAMEQEAQWKIGQSGLQREVPDFLEFVYFEGLSTLNPATISIIH